MDTLGSTFKDQIQEAISLSRAPTHVTADNVYQEGNQDIRPIHDYIVDALVLPGSGLDGIENLEELMGYAKAGKSCLLLPEHYSNLDTSMISLFIRRTGNEDIANAIIAIAGTKLNEDNPIVAALASAYTRIVVYRIGLDGSEAEKNKDELVRSNAINRSAMKKLDLLKKQGKLVLIYPAGTRYRPWDPSTKRGVREIDSYLRTFDYMCLIAINGKVLHVQQTDMMNDAVSNDLVRITAGPVLSCDEFRKKTRQAADAAGIEDKRQATVDAIMAELELMHDAAEEKRKKLI